MSKFKISGMRVVGTRTWVRILLLKSFLPKKTIDRLNKTTDKGGNCPIETLNYTALYRIIVNCSITKKGWRGSGKITAQMSS